MERKSVSVPPTLSDEMKPILWILRLLTVTPFSIDKGRVRFSWQSWPMAWAVTSYVVMSIYAVYVFTVKYSDLFVESRSFSDAIFFLTFLQLLHHHFVSPFVHWPEAKGLSNYFQSWNDFQIEFHKATGSPLEFDLRHKGWEHFALTLAVPALLCFVATCLLQPLRGYELAPYISTGMFHAIMPRTWNMFGLAVLRTGEQLQENFDAVLSKGDAEAAKSLKSLRRLWTKLRRLAETPGLCWGVTTLHFLLYCLVTLLMSAFGVMAALQQGTLSARGKTQVCIAVDNLAHALTVCSAGSLSCYTVTTCMRDRLLELNLKSTSVAFREEVGTFLQVIQDSRKNIWLSGFLVLDRVLFILMVSIVVTYLCVLAQFGAALNQLYE